ncbi:hypothetical protein GCM10010168_44470 [Actinoplanes ianthinogenes]|uniref:Peptidase inhibitor family I36 n=1 Tax=Actinoplanes ianthinogenes TaxID=122358 RepID=A0ABM7LPS9_9ACTN|nr:hypothetical protein [Actinoplanes ianthinogenes]BCJ41255.1 hypothetical protein Aiant_19120 [Actinoplanes ianthinogenes]GGR21877.1 hypothetical protein GCM10010168_44470 [Actinoplanes ianthinogenes]
MKKFHTLVATGVAAAALGVFAAPTAAFAATSEVDQCGPPIGDGTCSNYVAATITWYNRTAGIDGCVYDNFAGADFTGVVFEAYAGSTKIDSTTRSANDTVDDFGIRCFGFTIGDPDLVGGIDRIKVTVRRGFASGGYANGAWKNYQKKDAS